MKQSAFGWQTSLADLSLILFMLAAAAIHEGPAPATTPQPPLAPVRPAMRSEPLAVYDATPDAPALGVWLEQQAPDPRHQLTITARYDAAPGARQQALAQAARLLDEAGAAGRSARIVVEPGSGPVRVALAYDTPGSAAGTAFAQ